MKHRGWGIGWRLWDADGIHRDWDVELDVGDVRPHCEDDCQTEDHGHRVQVELLGLEVRAEVSIHGADDRGGEEVGGDRGEKPHSYGARRAHCHSQYSAHLRVIVHIGVDCTSRVNVLIWTMSIKMI